MQMSQDQAGYHYYQGLSQEQANEMEQIQFDQARHESMMAHMEAPPTPFFDHAFGDPGASSSYDAGDPGASSSYPPPAEDPSQTPHAVDPTDAPRRSQRARVDTSRFSHSQYPDHHVHAQRRQ